MPATILYIDDQEELLDLYRTLLSMEGYHVLTAATGAAGLELFKSENPDLVLLDYRMPEMDGAAVATKMREFDAEVPIVMLSGDNVPESVSALADAVVLKGAPTRRLLFILGQLTGAIANAPTSASWKTWVA